MKHKKDKKSKKDKKDKKLRKERKEEKRRLKEALKQTKEAEDISLTQAERTSASVASDSDADVTVTAPSVTPLPADQSNISMSRLQTQYQAPEGYEAIEFDGTESEDIVYWEDVMSGKEELWLGEIPANFDLQQLSGQVAVPGKDVQIGSDDWVTSTEQWSDQTRANHGMCVLLPSRDNQCFMPVQEIHGAIRPRICMQPKSYPMPEVTKNQVAFPEGLQQRFVPFGSEKPRVSVGYREVKRFKKKHQSTILIDEGHPRESKKKKLH